MKITMEGFVKPSPLSLDGNVSENWRRFKQKFEIFVTASGFEKKTKPERCCMLLNLAGEQAIDVYNTFTYKGSEGDTPAEDPKDPDVVIQKFEAYCNPKKNITYERHVFNTRVQAVNETIDAYVTELRLQTRHCQFGTLCEELIRDRIVVGIRNDTVRSRLLRESELTLQKAMNICRAAEQTSCQLTAIKNEATLQELKPRSGKAPYISKKPQKGNRNPQKTQIMCKYCGKTHDRDKTKCPAYGKECKVFGKKNCFAKVC